MACGTGEDKEMTWSEMGPDLSAGYHVCKVCKEAPAFAAHDDRDGWIQEGPYCQDCWKSFIDSLFVDLRKRLDDEDWGSSPETRREIIGDWHSSTCTCEECLAYCNNMVRW